MLDHATPIIAAIWSTITVLDSYNRCTSLTCSPSSLDGRQPSRPHRERIRDRCVSTLKDGKKQVIHSNRICHYRAAWVDPHPRVQQADTVKSHGSISYHRGHGPVLPRTTSFGWKVSLFPTKASFGDSNISSTERVISTIGCRMVVSGGPRYLALSIASNPMTDRSSGMRSPS